MTRIAAHLIIGFPGAGKTTLLRALLAQRPRKERWALLLNAAGGIDNDDGDGVAVRHISGGCACCSARVAFRVALVQLLRTARPQRLWIELAGTGDPAGIHAVLGESSIERAVTLSSTLCVVQPRHLANADISGHDLFRSQLRHADHVILADEQDNAAARHTLATLAVPATAVALLNDAALHLLQAQHGASAHSNDNSRQIAS
jgi:G3E family GTPase